MRLTTITLGLGLALGLGGAAAAQTTQCFNPNGTSYGPLYQAQSPVYPGWPNWVRVHGGHCRAVGQQEARSLERLPQAYPPDFLASRFARTTGYDRPGYYPPPPGQPGYEPGERDWRGDPGRAAFLLTQWLANQGRPYAQVIDTGRIRLLYDRQWRIFFARWPDGRRTSLAVRFSRRDGGSYQAMQSYGAGAWGQPEPIGQ